MHICIILFNSDCIDENIFVCLYLRFSKTNIQAKHFKYKLKVYFCEKKNYDSKKKFLTHATFCSILPTFTVILGLIFSKIIIFLFSS